MSGLCNSASPATPAQLTAAEAAILAAIAGIAGIGGGAASTIGITRSALLLSFPLPSFVIKECVAASSLSGAMGAGVLKTALNYVGGGYVDIFALQENSALAQTFRVVITVDGVAIDDTTWPATAGGGGVLGLVAVGDVISPSAGACVPCSGMSIRFNTSIKIEYSTSITAVDSAYEYIALRKDA